MKVETTQITDMKLSELILNIMENVQTDNQSDSYHIRE